MSWATFSAIIGIISGKGDPALPLSPLEWHNRFVLQARWTRKIRTYIFKRARVLHKNRILEIGCGTGAIINETIPIIGGYNNQNIGKDSYAHIFGLDLNINYLLLASNLVPGAELTQGDGHTLPYPRDCFDLTICHFLLLWVTHPEVVVTEMARVTAPGGAVFILAEPDYGGRIDYPLELEQLGIWQHEALKSQGAEPNLGRQLASILNKAGLKNIEVGVLGGQWKGKPEKDEWESEWMVLLSDLQNYVPLERLEQLQKIDANAWKRGERILYVPTFYGWGRVPE